MYFLNWEFIDLLKILGYYCNVLVLWKFVQSSILYDFFDIRGGEIL